MVLSNAIKISIHALLAESDFHKINCQLMVKDFYPRSPCGERRLHKCTQKIRPRFLSTLSLRRATKVVEIGVWCLIFLSTLSLRRATVPLHDLIKHFLNFYPRSPCGERPICKYAQHAVTGISIHALLAESDSQGGLFQCQDTDFYPRSPCGERPLFLRCGPMTRRYFYPRSPCGERPKSPKISTRPCQFLSTLSLRRATGAPVDRMPSSSISIHALLAESDAEQTETLKVATLSISIHALLAESDRCAD